VGACQQLLDRRMPRAGRACRARRVLCHGSLTPPSRPAGRPCGPR
jgi:hypothetical protein